MKELPKRYDPKEVEGRIYSIWEKGGFFTPKIDKTKKPYTIVLPPPNITGSLHMGHALNSTVQDILIRWQRMKGVPTLWLPGTDHAGIATQNVVEKELAREGKSRHDLGRAKFIERVWQWKEEYGEKIIDQLKKLGCSCDWSRQRFTMDEGYTEAVNAAFKHYYKKGWIYQGERVINWCVRCQTALSDIEVEHITQKAKLYYFKYDKSFPITIATTRPETKLGDTAVAVNPDDKRYQEFIGKTFKVNFVGVERKIRIIAEKNIDPAFGTGAVGITPAHSLIDYEIAEKNGLPLINVIDKFGKMTKEAGKDYEGLKATEASAKIVEKLKSDGLLEKEEKIDNALSVCYRCNRPIEPQPSKQWFLKMKELAKPAIEAVEKGEIKFTPERWKKVYLDWMKNLKDWCISRQIWWGHRLPVYQQEEIPNPKSQILNKSKIQNSNNLKIENLKLKIYVGDNSPAGYVQSPDVLDTWFSSALWPVAVFLKKNDSNSKVKMKNEKLRKAIDIFGEDLVTDDLNYFYPTTTLSTARDIIYLWVARMIFSGYEFMGEKPFANVYIHPTVLTKEGKRMSKSLGTGVDPMDLIEKYGADATRFGLMYQNTGIQDMRFSEDVILAARNFANKVWNAARFIIMNLESPKSPTLRSESDMKSSDRNPKSPQLRDPAVAGQIQNSNDQNSKPVARTEGDKIILNKLDKLIDSVDADLEKFQFGKPAHDLYDFFWHDFCDIYLEKSKEQLKDEKLKINTQEILYYILTTSLKLIHPFMPYITEEIWQNLGQKELIISNWPK